jgi:hypothetical protein
VPRPGHGMNVPETEVCAVLPVSLSRLRVPGRPGSPAVAAAAAAAPTARGAGRASHVSDSDVLSQSPEPEIRNSWTEAAASDGELQVKPASLSDS